MLNVPCITLHTIWNHLNVCVCVCVCERERERERERETHTHTHTPKDMVEVSTFHYNAYD